MDDHTLTYLGRRRRLTETQLVGMSVADRRHHIHIIGKTGTGKSTLLRNLILQDIWQGHGLALIDPHGDLADELLDHIPPHRTNEVVYFNPADTDYPIGLNLLQHVAPDHRHLVASGVVGAFRSMFSGSWGPRTEYILYATVAALLECQNVSLLAVPRMLSDPVYRAWVLRQVKDPSLRAFWLDEFEQYGRQFQRKAVAPIQNKIGQVLLAPILRNIFGQVRSGFNPRFMMDHGRIFIGSLSKGKLGADKANLLGALLTTQFQLAAMERADTPEAERRDFFLYVDEFSNFVTDSFASILSEARKYRLGLVLGHQYVGQLDPRIQDAIFGNVGTHISFRVGYRDAELMSQEYGNTFTPSYFGELDNYQAYVKLLQRSEQGVPFKLETFQPDHGLGRRRQHIVQTSRQRYASKKVDEEDKILRWMHRSYESR